MTKTTVPGAPPRRATRLGVLAATAALAATGLAAPAHADTQAPAAAETARPAPADRLASRVAAGWLGRQFVDGNHLQSTYNGFTYDDAGLTLDGVLAFAATKTNSVRSARAITWLSDPGVLGGYIGSGSESYAGAHGKLAYTLHVTGNNPYSFGGRNIIAELVDLQQPNGRLSDESAFGDYSNAFGQSFGVLALHRAGRGGPANRAASYLQGQACPDGGVPTAFEEAECSSGADSTAMALQAFVAAKRWGAANEAAAWLVDYVADGGVTNANTAGLIAAGLDARGGARNTAAANDARALIRDLQAGCSAPFRIRGSIAYDSDGYDVESTARATAQSTLGLAAANLSTLTDDGAIGYAPTLAC